MSYIRFSFVVVGNDPHEQIKAYEKKRFTYEGLTHLYSQPAQNVIVNEITNSFALLRDGAWCQAAEIGHAWENPKVNREWKRDFPYLLRNLNPDTLISVYNWSGMMGDISQWDMGKL